MAGVPDVACAMACANASADACCRWLRRRLVNAAWSAGGALRGDQVLLDHLQQLRDAQLVHAGTEVMGLSTQILVHALGQPDGDYPGRLTFGVGRVLLLPELDQPFLDLVELGAFFEGREVFEAGELAANDAVDTQNLAKERYPVWLRFKELTGGLQDLLILLRRFSKHGIVSFQGRAEMREGWWPAAKRPTSGSYLVAF